MHVLLFMQVGEKKTFTKKQYRKSDRKRESRKFFMVEKYQGRESGHNAQIFENLHVMNVIRKCDYLLRI